MFVFVFCGLFGVYFGVWLVFWGFLGLCCVCVLCLCGNGGERVNMVRFMIGFSVF